MDDFEFGNTLAYPAQAPAGKVPGEAVAIAIAAASFLLSMLSGWMGDSQGVGALTLLAVLLLFVCMVALIFFAIMCIGRVYRLSSKKGPKLQKESVLTEVHFSGKKVSVIHWRTNRGKDAKGSGNGGDDGSRELLKQYFIKPGNLVSLVYDESQGMLEIIMEDPDGAGEGTVTERWYPMADPGLKASLLERFSRYVDKHLQGKVDSEALLESAGREWARSGSQPWQSAGGGRGWQAGNQGGREPQAGQATVLEPKEADPGKGKPYAIAQGVLLVASIVFFLYFSIALDDGVIGAILFIVLFAASFAMQLLGTRAGKLKRNARQRAAICDGRLELLTYRDRQGPDSDLVTYSFYFTPDASEAPRISSIEGYRLEGGEIAIEGDFRKTDLTFGFDETFHDGIMANGPIPYDLPWRGPDTEEVSEIVIERDFEDEGQLLDQLDRMVVR